jgi:septal ring factor EnvC (AmiA/AmiB activator)
MQWLLLLWIGIFSYLIINWIFNGIQMSPVQIIEGVANAAPAAAAPAAAAPAAAAPAPAPAPGKNAAAKNAKNTKCPEDCTSVKELQTKLSEAMKNVSVLESNIEKNTAESVEHSNSIRDMNQAITDMQKDQKDE